MNGPPRQRNQQCHTTTSGVGEGGAVTDTPELPTADAELDAEIPELSREVIHPGLSGDPVQARVQEPAQPRHTAIGGWGETTSVSEGPNP